MLEELEFLKARLIEQKAAILLGAGFSYGAQNSGGNNLPLGKELSEKLYQHFYVDNPLPNFTKDYVAKVESYKTDLRKICTILASENRRKIRDTYLSNVFSGSHPVGNQFQALIKNYSWRSIFTLNIDDLTENIFNQSNTPLCIWNYSKNGDRSHDTQRLIKLHGDIADPDKGFVFDDDEYTNFTLESNCLLKEFAHCFLNSDMILLGTEFQEIDLSFILKLYESSGYDGNGHHYFFVVPSINDIVLRNKIQNTSNFHWIKMNTEEFLSYVTSNVTEPRNQRSLLKEYGTVFLDEIEHKENYKSKIYSGKYTQYNDFFYDWDIRYPGQRETVLQVLKNRKPTIITLFGKPYSGKTTVAKRYLVDFENNDYISFEVMNNHQEVFDCLTTYLYNVGKEAKIAILLENAAFQYEYIADFIQTWASYCTHLVIITTDSIDNHRTKNHFLCNLPKEIMWHEIEITEKISAEFAAKVYFTLCVNHRLNYYLQLLPPKSSPTRSDNMMRIQNKMKKINDIIEVLYYSTEGEFFRDHYSKWMEAHKESYYIEYLFILCMLSKLGIYSVPTQCVSQLIPSKVMRFSVKELLNSYSEILEEKEGHTKLLRGRIVMASLPTLSSDLIKDAIKQLVLYTLGLFQEGDNNEYYELFQKVLRIKRIRNYAILNRSQLNELFSLLEKTPCSSISYFWIQYGLVAQLINDYDEANNHFLYARRIRPNSYQVAHALAKNLMEMGLYELINGKSNADETFERGCQEMSSIIASPDYTRAFNYSVHSYANMIMKYYHIKETLIPFEKCEEIQQYFKMIMAHSIDSEMKEIIITFYKYCERNEIAQYCEGLEDIWHIRPIVVTKDDDYDN